MSEEHKRPESNLNNEVNYFQDDKDNFDYMKIIEETDEIERDLKKLSENVSKLTVESSVLIVELLSKMDAIDLKAKIEEVEKKILQYQNNETEMEVDRNIQRE